MIRADKIRFAEEWMRAEALASPGKRGVSLKTSQRIAQAEALALLGKSVAEIAETLDITHVAILNWCARGRVPRLKEILAARKDVPISCSFAR